MIRVACLLLCLVATSAARADDDFFMNLGVPKSPRLAGLLDHILPVFKSTSNVRVQVVALDPGQESALDKNGKAKINALLLDDRAAIDKVMSEKFGALQHAAFADDAVIVGPKSDPAGIRGFKDAGKAFAQIAAKGASFVGGSRGVNDLEQRLWSAAGVKLDKSAAWYRKSKQDMPGTLKLAAANDTYTLVDRATWAGFKDPKNLEILSEGDAALFKVYSNVMVDPEKEQRDKYIFTRIWSDWVTGKNSVEAISSYKINGSQIFFPCQGDTEAVCQSATK